MEVSTSIDGSSVAITGGETVNTDTERFQTLDGERVSEEAVAAWSAEYAKFGVFGGRPTLAKDQTPSVRVACLVPVELKTRLKDLTKTRGTAEAAIIREALEAYLGVA